MFDNFDGVHVQEGGLLYIQSATWHCTTRCRRLFRSHYWNSGIRAPLACRVGALQPGQTCGQWM